MGELRHRGSKGTDPLLSFAATHENGGAFSASRSSERIIRRKSSKILEEVRRSLSNAGHTESAGPSPLMGLEGFDCMYLLRPSPRITRLAHIQEVIWHSWQMFQGYNLFLLVSGPLFVWVCREYELVCDLNPSIYTAPIVFPLSFAINSSFGRRETVLNELASFKAMAIGAHQVFLAWAVDSGEGFDVPRRVVGYIRSLVYLTTAYLSSMDRDQRALQLSALYVLMGKLQVLVEDVRRSKLDVRQPMYARLLNNTGALMMGIERMRVIREYRTPRTIRAFIKVSTFFLPLLVAPYFAHVAMKSHPVFGYGSSAIMCFMFGLLMSVQDVLDDPFDQDGQDDINFADFMEPWVDECAAEIEVYEKMERAKSIFADAAGENVTNGANHTK